MTPKLETFSSLVRASYLAARNDKVRIHWAEVDELVSVGGPLDWSIAQQDGGWDEFVTQLLYSAVNYRFVHLDTLERPSCLHNGVQIHGSEAYELDLRRVCGLYGFDRGGVRRIAEELHKREWLPTVTRGICDEDNRVQRIRYLASCIDRDWAAFRDIYEAGDLDGAIERAWFTGLFVDPFLKRLQHLSFALMRRVSKFHPWVQHAGRLTVLCDYRLAELLMHRGVIGIETLSSKTKWGPILRLRGEDRLVLAIRGATAEVGEEISRRTGATQIAVDQDLWHRARGTRCSTAMLIDTEAF